MSRYLLKFKRLFIYNEKNYPLETFLVISFEQRTRSVMQFITTLIKCNDNSKCRSIYVEPIQWIIAHLEKWDQSSSDLMTGNILCPKCDQESESYNWQRIEDVCDCLSHKGIDFFSLFKIN